MRVRILPLIFVQIVFDKNQFETSEPTTTSLGDLCCLFTKQIIESQILSHGVKFQARNFRLPVLSRYVLGPGMAMILSCASAHA
jgi:hypothetical protein